MEVSEFLDSQRAGEIDLLSSLATEGCIDRRLSYNEGGARYNFCNWCAIGLVNLVDSLSIIRQFVFQDKRFTLKELTIMLEKNWAGYEEMRRLIIHKGKFFGNDLDEVDSIAVSLVDTLYGLTDKKTPFRGGRYNFGTLAGIENMHIHFGSRTNATPDGRFAGDPMVASIGAGQGKDFYGPTAMLKSIAKIDYTKLPSSVVVNLRLDTALTKNENEIEMIAKLVETFFLEGGPQIQINYLTPQELLDAQKNPLAYNNLRVRVTGYSSKFISLDEKLQNEIISRTGHNL